MHWYPHEQSHLHSSHRDNGSELHNVWSGLSSAEVTRDKSAFRLDIVPTECGTIHLVRELHRTGRLAGKIYNE